MEGAKFQENWFSCFGAPGLHFLVFSCVLGPLEIHFLVFSRVGASGAPFSSGFLVFWGFWGSISSCFLVFWGLRGSISSRFLVFWGLWGLPGCVLHMNLRGKRDSRRMCKKPRVFSVLASKSTPGRPEPEIIKILVKFTSGGDIFGGG